MPRPARWALVSLVATFAALAQSRASAASPWTAGLATGSTTQSLGGGIGTPATVTATCRSALSTQIDVSWPVVSRATKYVVLQSTNGGNFTAITTVSTNSWSSAPNLSIATYAYRIKAGAGTNWFGADSTSSLTHTIAAAACL